VALLEQVLELAPQPLAGQAVEDPLPDGGRDQVPGVGSDREGKPPRVADGANGARWVVDEGKRVQDSDLLALDVLASAEEIDQLAVALAGKACEALIVKSGSRGPGGSARSTRAALPVR
jgi:hypothetical protein